MNRKQQLLKQHRQKKRMLLVGLACCLLALIIASYFITMIGYFILPFIFVIWLAHEAWLSDHLFYSPKQDYLYHFPKNTFTTLITIEQGKLNTIDSLPSDMDTLFVAVKLNSSFIGNFVDPQVIIASPLTTDRQDFERGVNGIRYINLSGLVEELQQGKLTLTTKHCQLEGELTLYAFSHPNYNQQRIMIIAPHADDAELAAFGQYSQNANTSIITLTQGEIEAEYYQATLKLNKMEAAQLKGRLRSWDSIAIPLWGGIPTTQSIQLGYYCLQLKAMHQNPQQAFASRESNEADTRLVRHFNSFALPSDNDGLASWQNLQNDMVFLIDHFKPDIIISPHPEIDPHEDHVEATRLVEEVLQKTHWQPSYQLFYANHLHDNDRWPMGPVHCGIALPPLLEESSAYSLWSPLLSNQVQLNKAMALKMEHDLQTPMPYKKKLRRVIQKWLTGRTWPTSGESEFFRKAVRRHELFWVKPLK